MHKILIISVSAGAGHVRAAQALEAYAKLYGEKVEALHIDVMDYVPAGFRKIYSDFYIQLVEKVPSIWGYLYNYSNEAKANSAMEKLRRKVERINTRALLKKIAAYQPDDIICTHFLPVELLSRLILRKELSSPVWVQVTDFDLHRLWIHEGMAGYFVANEEIAFRLQTQGIAAEKIHTTGIPIMPAFAQDLSRESCASALGLDPKRTTILLMGGGAGMGGMDLIAEQLLQVEADFQLVVLAGKNILTLEALQKLAVKYPTRLYPQGFTKQVERVMACTDLMITKPGGLTSSESLAMGLPMIVNAPIPGQEERNADFLLENGAALKAYDATSLLFRVKVLLNNPAKLAQMRSSAKSLGRPLAAQQVIEKVLACQA